MSDDNPARRLEFYGGVPALFIPFAVMLAGILWLGFTGLALPEAFWPMVLAGLFVGLLLARSKQAYVDALIAGVGSRMLAVILLAWFLAGVLGTLLSQTGVIDGLVWLSLQAGVSPAWFPLITFVAAGILSMSTGTSIGTILATTPILFPAGFAIGADPLLLVGAIIGGAFVGDNLAPISDTTIVSAYSQGAEIPKVVRTRLKYAATAAAATLGLYVVFALTGPQGQAARGDLDVGPQGLIMLLAPALLIVLMVAGYHFVVSLLYSIAFGLALGLVTGLLTWGDLLTVDGTTFTASGIIVDGMSGLVGIAVFTIFLMGLIGTFEHGGLIDWLMERSRRFARSPRSAEASIVSVSLAVNALTTAGTPTMVMIGPFVRRLGHRFRIAPWRRGNLLDACSTTIIGFLPYSVAVLIPFGLVQDTVQGANLSGFNPVGLVPYVFYCWALMIVIIVAAITGWGREYQDDAAWAAERTELGPADGSVDGSADTQENRAGSPR